MNTKINHPGMFNPELLTDDEIEMIFALQMDSQLQQQILNDPERDWMFGYVVDSGLFQRFLDLHGD